MSTAGNKDELDHEDYENITDEFKEMMRTKLTWHYLKAMDIWVFWIDDKDDDDDGDDDDSKESESLRTHYAGSSISDPAAKTVPMANWKLRSIIRKVLMVADGMTLVQFWVPKTVGDRTILTTADQPFGFSFIDETFCYLRMLSADLEYSVYGEGDPGIIGHVFQKHITAITPDVKYYTREEYPQRDDAISASILSSIACPLIEPSTKRCIGVIEVLSTSVLQASRIFSVIEDVGLASSGIQGHDISPADYERQYKAVKEMADGVRVVCETHKLPLVQSWFRCKCRSCIDVKSEGSCLIRRSRYGDYVSFALDDSAREFLRACSADLMLPILQKGQGVAGRALSSYRPSFCGDVTRFNIAEYPLVHLARVFGLAGSFAICLRSSLSGDADYVLEFFLPRKRNGWDPRALLCSILETMKQQLPSFKVASGEELGQELSVEYIDILKKADGSSPMPSLEDMMQPELPIPQLMMEHNGMDDEGNVVGEDDIQSDRIVSEDNANGKTVPNENELTEASVGDDALGQHSEKKLDSAAESFGGDDSWRKDRSGDDLDGEQKSKKRKSTEEIMPGSRERERELLEKRNDLGA